MTTSLRFRAGLTALALLCGGCARHDGDDACPLGACGGTRRWPATPRPNIVFITTDDMRVSDLWAMPNVQELLVERVHHLHELVRALPALLSCSRQLGDRSVQPQQRRQRATRPRTSPRGAMRRSMHRAPLRRGCVEAGYQTAFVGKYLNGYGSVKPVSARRAGRSGTQRSLGNYFFTRLREKNEVPRS